MRALLTIATLAACAVGCDDIDNFDVEVRDEATLAGATIVEGVLGGFPTVDAFTRFDLSQSAEFEERGYSPDDVDSIHLTRLRLRVVDPADQDLSFLGPVEVVLQNPDLPAITIASQTDFPPASTQVDFETSAADLKRYLLGTRSSITFSIEDARRPEQDTRVEILAVFDVDVNVI